MKIKLISEDFPAGLDVEWPFAPGTGDTVAFRNAGGTTVQRVALVQYESDAAGNLQSVTIHLEY
jgi:hypothetical protein